MGRSKLYYKVVSRNGNKLYSAVIIILTIEGTDNSKSSFLILSVPSRLEPLISILQDKKINFAIQDIIWYFYQFVKEIILKFLEPTFNRQ